MALEANEMQLDPEKRCEVLGASPSASRHAVEVFFEVERGPRGKHRAANVQVSRPVQGEDELPDSGICPIETKSSLPLALWLLASRDWLGLTEASQVRCAKEREGQ
jgi:hypothetical protein